MRERSAPNVLLVALEVYTSGTSADRLNLLGTLRSLEAVIGCRSMSFERLQQLPLIERPTRRSARNDRSAGTMRHAAQRFEKGR